MERVEYGTDGYPYKLSMSTGIENTEQHPTVKAIPKDQYESRLKADIVAILTEIQLDIEEHKMTSGVTNQGTWNECIACCSRIIQQKINALKREQE